MHDDHDGDARAAAPRGRRARGPRQADLADRVRVPDEPARPLLRASRQQRQAQLLGQAALRAYRAPRVDMLIHYLVRDEPAARRLAERALHLRRCGRSSAAQAFPLPLAIAGRSGGAVVVWGQVRPGRGPQTYRVQVARPGSGWTGPAARGRPPRAASSSVRLALAEGARACASGRPTTPLTGVPCRSPSDARLPRPPGWPARLANVHEPPVIRGGLAARLTSLVLGLFLCACGIVAFLQAGLGLPPWDVLHQGIADQTPLSFGDANLVVSLVVLVVAGARCGARIGLGTVAERRPDRDVRDRADARSTPSTSSRTRRSAARIALMLVRAPALRRRLGALHRPRSRRRATRLADARCSRSGWPCGSASRARRSSSRRSLLGFALGGTVGIGTLVFALGIGPAVELSFRVLARTPLVAPGSSIAPREGTKGLDLRGRRGDAARRADAGHEQAPAAGRQLADDLLPAAAAPAGRDPRGARRHRQGARGPDDRPARRRPARRRAAPRSRCSTSISPTRCRPRPAGSRRWSGWRAISPAGEQLVVVLGDNIFEHAHAAELARWADDGDGRAIFVKDVPDPENFGVVAYDEDGRVDRHRREGGRRRHALRRAADLARRRRALLLPAGRLRRDRRRSRRRAAASSRSRTSTATTPQRGRLEVCRGATAGGRTRASTGSTSPRSAGRSSETGANNVIDGLSAAPAPPLRGRARLVLRAAPRERCCRSRRGRRTSRSRGAGVIRGLHYHERGQDDLFVCLQGMARVVVLDRDDGRDVHARTSATTTRSRSTSPAGTRTASRRSPTCSSATT